MAFMFELTKSYLLVCLVYCQSLNVLQKRNEDTNQALYALIKNIISNVSFIFLNLTVRECGHCPGKLVPSRKFGGRKINLALSWSNLGRQHSIDDRNERKRKEGG